MSETQTPDPDGTRSTDYELNLMLDRLGLYRTARHDEADYYQAVHKCAEATDERTLHESWKEIARGYDSYESFIEAVRYRPGMLDEPHFGWLTLNCWNNPGVSLIDRLCHYRDFIENCPPYKSTFPIKQLLDGIDYRPQGVRPYVLEFCGAWRMPGHFPGSKSIRTTQYIIPSAPDAWMYSDVAFNCENCGGLIMGTDKTPRRSEAVPGDIGHKDGCPRIWHHQSACRFWEGRKRVVTQSLQYNHPVEWVSARGGYMSTNGAHYTRSMGISGNEQRAIGREKLAHTAMSWVHIYPPEKIARAFGMSKTALKEAVREYVGYSLRAAYRLRGHPPESFGFDGGGDGE